MREKPGPREAIASKKDAKKAAIPALVDKDESDDDDSDSEEPSPVKPQTGRVARAELTRRGAIPKRSLADEINEMVPAEWEEFQTQMEKAFIAKAARSGDSAHLPCKVYNNSTVGDARIAMVTSILAVQTQLLRGR